jgi:rhodanese-related sulfurtransferase
MAAQRIPISELKNKLDEKEKLVLVDVRDRKEVSESGSIPGAIHIPMSEVEKHIGQLPKDSEIVFY